MCGIAGIIQKQKEGSIKESIFDMSQAIKHRGPDGEGFTFFSDSIEIPAFSNETPKVNCESNRFLFNPKKSLESVSTIYQMAFAHRRLSIIDLSESGHQPMCDVSSNYWITFNGEIFNYLELKKELKEKGHVFLTKTDTEVVLASYKEWGTDCLQKFNGMWAFALYDKTKQQVFCARDRVGVKPFYFINTNTSFAFASEQKAFLKSGLINFEINETQQIDFLINGKLETTEQSLFKGIYELKPAHYLLYNLKTTDFEIKKYYDISTQPKIHKTEGEIINDIETKLKHAIELRLRSDVEIGSCLSGGLDSSIIAGIIKNLQPEKNIKLFTAVFPTEIFDESSYAKQVSNYVNGSWFTVSPTETEFFRDIETLNYSQDLPIWSTSTYSQYRVMKLASEHNIKVLLDGQGADELFGGYTHHYFSLWKEIPLLSRLKNINASKQTIHNPFLNFGKQLLKENFHLGVDYSNYFNEDFTLNSKTETTVFSNTLNQQLKNDYNGNLKSFLKCEDRCSMAFGIESRVPFADDVELVDYIFSVEGTKKIKNGVSKYLLREAAKQYIPHKIYNRTDKIGFETPVSKWFINHKTLVLETIFDQLDFVNHSFLKSNFSILLNHKPTFLLRLYSLAIWKKVFIEINN
jgi:asparagine synthase (glutamine-hydrolysing)